MKKIRIQVPQPCHENWNTMTKTEQGRFCQACSKDVIDFTLMSDKEILKVITHSSGKMCGRFANNQLNRTLQEEKKQKRLFAWKYFWQMLIPAFFFTKQSFSQEGMRSKKPEVICSKPVKGGIRTIAATDTSQKRSSIKGKVLDETGKGVIYATVMIKGTSQGTLTDGSGNFNLQVAGDNFPIELVASSAGYERTEVSITDTASQVQIDLTMRQALAGEIVIVGFITKSPVVEVPLITKLLDTAFKKFRVYPNPIIAGTVAFLDLKTPAGDYEVELIDIAGRVISSEQIVIDMKPAKLPFRVPSLIPGVYYLRITGKTSRKQYVEKIVIQ